MPSHPASNPPLMVSIDGRSRETAMASMADFLETVRDVAAMVFAEERRQDGYSEPEVEILTGQFMVHWSRPENLERVMNIYTFIALGPLPGTVH